LNNKVTLPGQFQVFPASVKATTVALTFHKDITWEDFGQAGSVLHTMAGIAQDCLPYWLGDFINTGEDFFPNVYTQAIEVASGVKEGGYDYRTLQNWSYLCRKVPAENRGIMSVGHTMVVAPLPPEKQYELLIRAKKEGLLISELRRLANGDENYKSKSTIDIRGEKYTSLMNEFEEQWEIYGDRWSSLSPREAARDVWSRALQKKLSK